MVNEQQLDRIFSALGDPTRRRIVERLSRRTLTIGQLSQEFPISQPAVSKHVRILEESGLLQREVVGRVHYCSLDPAALDGAMRWVERQRKYWNAALDRLELILSKPGSKRK